MTQYLGDNQDPQETSCSNTGDYVEPRFTCPGCYADIDGGQPDNAHKCTSCGAILMLRKEMVPEYIAAMIEADDVEDYEDQLEEAGLLMQSVEG